MCWNSFYKQVQRTCCFQCFCACLYEPRDCSNEITCKKCKLQRMGNKEYKPILIDYCLFSILCNVLSKIFWQGTFLNESSEHFHEVVSIEKSRSSQRPNIPTAMSDRKVKTNMCSEHNKWMSVRKPMLLVSFPLQSNS